MLRFARPVLTRALLAGVAVALLAPVVVGVTALDEAKRRKALNRPLTKPPAVETLLTDPAGALGQTTDYLADRTGGVVSAGRLLARTRYHLLQDPGAQVLARDGNMVFLLNHNANRPNEMNAVRRACRVLNPGNKWVDRLIGRIRTVRKGLDAPGRRFGLLAMVSKPVLYHGRLPAKVPRGLRERCRRSRDDLTWANLVRDALAREGVPFVYPMAELMAARGERSFYPAGNFHSDGAASHVAAFALLNAMEPEAFVPGSLGYKEVERRADLGTFLPFERYHIIHEPLYGARRALHDRPTQKAMIARYPALAQTLAYRTRPGKGPRLGRRALVIGNSFGRWITRHLAVAFDETFYINTNGITRAGARQLFTTIVPEYDPDTILFVYHDAGLKHDQGAWLRLSRAASPPGE